jgi:sugar/nucleoside kinase (ribokinase family)
MIDVITAGHLCVDIIPLITDADTAASDNFLAPGRLTEVGGALLSTGGSVSNTGIALFKLGLEVRLVARIGDDVIGNLTRDILAARSPKLVEELAVGHGEPSSYTIVISPPGIDRTFLHCPGTNNTFGPEDLQPELLRQARLLHFGYPPLMRRMFSEGGRELAAVMRKAKEHGLTTSLDMAMPDPTKPMGKADWPGILKLSLPYVDVFQPSVEELLYMLGRERFDELQRSVGAARMIDALAPPEISELAARTLALGTKVLALKLGHRGLYLRTARSLADMGRGAPANPGEWASRGLWAPCFKVDVVNTVGSGDSTIAGFLTGLLRGQSPEGALTSGVAVGACNVEAADTTSGVRPWEETQERVRRGWAKLDAHIEDPAWAWDESAGLWHGPNDRR